MRNPDRGRFTGRVDEEALPTNATAGIVRIGDTVRRPAGPWTDAVDDLLRHLERVGFAGSPRALGRDEQGRQVLEYVEGEAGGDAVSYSADDLAAVGRLVRDYHDAVTSFVPSPEARWNQVVPADSRELLCHGDPAAWNIIRAPGRWVLIDWDFAGPGTRLWELAWAAQTTAIPRPNMDARSSARRLRAIVDGYGLAERARRELVPLLPARTRAMYDLLRRGHVNREQPWARIWLEDGPHWLAMTEFLHRHRQLWLDALL